jgi:hypothetical protein
LKPAFDATGHDYATAAEIVRLLIDRFNVMLKDLQRVDTRFVYVDLRSFASDPEDWVDELHLANRTIRLAAQEYDRQIRAAAGEQVPLNKKRAPPARSRPSRRRRSAARQRV